MLPRKEILNIKPYVPGKPVEEVKRQLQIKGKVLKLASNENSLGPSPEALRAVKRALTGINRYPDGGCFYLKKKLARKLRIAPENLVFGCGSDELIILTLRAFLNKGDEVIIARPTFLIYELASRIAGAKIKFVPLDKEFRYDLRAIKNAITAKTRVVFIANPDNPTGTYVNAGEVDEFMRGLPRDLIVYFDEAYYELVEKRDFPRSLKYIDRNVVIARTFSKAYGLSGLRIGYGIARAEIIDYMNRVREPFNVNSLAQAAALAAIDDKKHLLRTRSLLREGKEYLYKSFQRLGMPYVESVTNFVLVKAGPRAGIIYERLLRKGVIVRNMDAWGMRDFLRVTVGTMPENRKFIRTLEEVK